LFSPRAYGMSQFQSTSSLQNSVITWSIPRTERFLTNKLYCDNIYNKPEKKTKISTTQGYGTKYDLMPMAGKGTPSPDCYNIKSLFENNNFHKKGVILAQKLRSPVIRSIKPT